MLHLRKALNDDSQHPSFIETVPRQGYRFISPIELSETPLVSLRPVAIEAEEAPRGRFWARVAALASVLAVAVTLSVLWGRFAETPAAPALPRLMIYPMHDASEGIEARSSAVSLTNDLVRILVTNFSDRLDLTAAGPQGADGTPATDSPIDADFTVMSSMSFDEHGDFGVTLRLIRAQDRTIVWADTRHIASEELADWPAVAAADLLAALGSLPLE